MSLVSTIDALIAYSLEKNLIGDADVIYSRNALLAALRCDSYDETGTLPDVCPPLPQLLNELAGYAVQNGVIPNSTGARDRFGTQLMGYVTPHPSEVQRRFFELYARSPEDATEYFYQLSRDCDYIRTHHIARDMRWKTATEYGELDITINLSKPEKDPNDIAAAKTQAMNGYPRCLLCIENEGYSGHAGHPARHNLRIIPIRIAGEKWGLQYSPYLYYNEHCIVLNTEHIPMRIDASVFDKLLSFVEQFPHYFVGSNADLPIVGGSILSHEHFQGGRYEFPMAKAPVEKRYVFNGFSDVYAGRVKWPMSVIRLRSGDSKRLTALAAHILDCWHDYSDPAVFVFSETGGTPHNTITPIARKRGGGYELDLVLRNNLTTADHPLGLFHPHEELHNIKKENIGLIEVMGLAVLPGRLKTEMELLRQAMLSGRDISDIGDIAKHADWYNGWRGYYDTLNEDTANAIIQDEIGKTFAQVLSHAGVFKRDSQGAQAFDRFMAHTGAHSASCLI